MVNGSEEGLLMQELNVVLSVPLQRLMDEHVCLRSQMEQFYEITEDIESGSGPVVVELFAKLYERVSAFTDELKAHASREEEGLFPMMMRHLGESDRTIEVMEQEHVKAEEHLQDFLTEAKRAGITIDEDEAQWITVAAVQAYATLTQHFAKEEKVLFPLAQKILSPEEMEELEQFFQS
jgi:regulator of cell morphogenesis and NO signaling